MFQMKKNHFTFSNSDFNFILISYPVWKAYIKSPILDSSIEVIPEIDINFKTINIPERQVEKKEKDSLQGKNFSNERCRKSDG